jgi:hypothetical protein
MKNEEKLQGARRWALGTGLCKSGVALRLPPQSMTLVVVRWFPARRGLFRPLPIYQLITICGALPRRRFHFRYAMADKSPGQSKLIRPNPS